MRRTYLSHIIVKTFLLHKRKITHSKCQYYSLQKLFAKDGRDEYHQLDINQHTFPHPKQWFWQSFNFCWLCQWPSGLGSDGRRGQEEQSQSPFFPLRQSNVVIFSFRFQVVHHGNFSFLFFDIRQSNMVIFFSFSFRFPAAQHGNFSLFFLSCFSSPTIIMVFSSFLICLKLRGQTLCVPHLISCHVALISSDSTT